MTVPSTSRMPARPPADELLRARIVGHLRDQGFVVSDEGVMLSQVSAEKEALRALHSVAVAEQRKAARAALSRHEDVFVHRLAAPGSVRPDRVDPVLVPIGDRRSPDALLWRWCALHWSIPVSSGYGRRLRFLVVDAQNDAVMGVIGLGDPVFALGARDRALGWTPERRREALCNVMDAFVLGAVPPYNRLLAGKLVALLATTDEVRRLFQERYGHRTTLIAARDPNATLALVTTTSALGRSSVYNRLHGPGGTTGLLPVGFTTGSGDFHLAGPIYAELAARAAAANPDGETHASVRWKTSGARNRREVIQRALDAVGLDSRLLRVHGVRRQVFLAPTISNYAAYLRDGQTPVPFDRPTTAVAAWWRKRWAGPRADRDPNWSSFDPQSWRLWTGPDSQFS